VKRIFFLTPQLPHPPVSGGVIKSRKMIEHLAARHEVHLFCLLKGSDQHHVDEFRARVPLAALHVAPVRTPRSAGALLRSYLAGVPLSVFRNRSSAMSALVNAAVSLRPDAMFVDHFLMFQYVPDAFDGRVVLHQHNAEYVMWQRFAELDARPLRKIAVHAESRRIRGYEARIGERARTILAAPNDIEALAALGLPRGKFRETLHLGDEELLDAPDIEFDHTELALLCVGSLDWEANRDGLIWFLREVWPLLKRRHPALRFSIVGRNPGAELQSVAGGWDGVRLCGFVDDVEPYYARSRVFVAPLRIGSGIKVKVVNALYRGLPVATTSIGAEGLQVESGRDIYIADQPAAMAEQIGDLLEHKDQWTRLRDSSRALARNRYTWHASLQRVEEAVHD
jgi:glycosyltransferase involved in cell wall biosynthesis